MHILIFEQRYTSLSEAGIGRFALFGREWVKSGNQVTVISGMINYISGKKPARYRGKLFSLESDNGIRVIRVFDSGLAYRTFIGRLFSYGTFLISAFLVGFFVNKPDVVIASSPPIFVGPIGFFVSVLRRATFIFEVRDLWPDEAVELGFLKNATLISMSRRLEQFLYRQARGIVVNSPGIARFLAEKKSVPEKKIYVVPNPTDLPAIRRKPPPPSRKEGKKFTILYTGSMSAVYDFSLIIEAAAALQKENILFVLVGDGRGKEGAMRQAGEVWLKNIVFLPPVSKEEVLDVVASADVCIAALKKNVGLLRYVYATKIFDYMAGAKPIVLAMEGVSCDLVSREAESGVCVSPGDLEGFIGAIYGLYLNPNGRKEMGERGLAYLKKNFEPASLAETYLRALTK